MAGDSFFRRALGRFFGAPRIPAQATGGKHALVVVPFHGVDAASILVDSAASSLKAAGYVVHALHYSAGKTRPRSPFWDHVYHLKAQTGSFGKSRWRPSSTGVEADFDRLDDWAGDELALFVARLGKAFDFEICICNYVFLSRALDSLPDTTARILYTHDVFAGRNERIAEAGGSPRGWYFSTTPSEEARGLRRADLVVAIQAEEAEYFAAAVGPERVRVYPYVPPRRFLAPRNSGAPFALGYIASAHYPNVDAIKSFIAGFDFSGTTVLRIAGTVCMWLAKIKLPPQVELLGVVDNLAGFYASCDLFINPDMLKSGLKIKCVEALSFGRPLICTEAAAAGIGVNADFHRARTIAEVSEHASRAIGDAAFLDRITLESRAVFDNFAHRYASADLIAKCREIVEARAKQACVE